jgi:hypothetical protein
MKPLSIFVTIILGIASLGVIVWIGQYRAYGLVKAPKAVDHVLAIEDLPLPSSGPFGKADIEETVFEFGTKLVGSTDKHTFTIKNSGEGKLEIKLGKPTCQCTVGEITKVDGEVIKQGPFPPGEEVALAPNESVNIAVQWVMKSETEKFRQQVPVFTTDPERRKLDLEITGSVDGAVHLSPLGLWDLGELSRTEPTKAMGVAYSTVLSDFTISEVTRENSPVKVSWEPADDEFKESKNAKSAYKISVEIDPKVPIGQLRELISLKIQMPEDELAVTDAEKSEPQVHEQFLNFSVYGHRSGPIEIRPVAGVGFSTTSNRLVLGEFPAAQGKKAKLTLFPKEMTEDLVLQSFEPADRFKITLGEGKVLGKTKSYLLELEVLPGPVGKHQNDQAQVVNLKLNHPEAPDLKLLIDYNAKN